MNIRETISMRSPNGIEEKCAKFTIDDIAMPFVFESVTKENEEYVFSAWIMSDRNSSITIENNEINLSTNWEKQKIVYNASGNSLKIYFNTTGTYYFYKSQLENGNISTDWSPAQEDLEAELEVKVNKDDLISEINASANVIRLKSNRLVVESDNLQIYEDGTLKTQRGEIGGFILHDKILSAEADKHAEINIKYHTYADAEPREGFIKIGNDAENEGGSGEGGIYVQDYDLDGYEVYTRIGNVLGGGILIETEEPNDALHIDHTGIARVDGKAVRIGNDIDVDGMEIKKAILEFMTPTFYTATTTGVINSHGFEKMTIDFGKTYLREPIVVIDDYGTNYQLIPTISVVTKTQCTIKAYASYASGSMAAGRIVRIRVYGITA